MPFRCLLRIRFAEKFLKGACARQDENHKSYIGSCEWDFCQKENFSLAELPLRAKKYGAGGMIPDFPGSPYSTDSPYSLPRFAVSPGCQQPHRRPADLTSGPAILTGVRRISQAGQQPHRRPADLTCGRRPLLMIRQFP